MSDTFEIKPKSTNYVGYYITRKNANLLKNSLESENCPFMPNEAGSITVEPIVNLNTGFVLNAKEQLLAQVVKANNGFTSNVVGTKTSFDNAKTTTSPEAQGFSITFQRKDGAYSHVKMYFPEETEHPERVMDYAKSATKQTYAFTDKTVKIENPDEYLEKYMFAVRTGAKLEVAKDVAEKFKQNMIAICTNDLAEKGLKNPKIEPLTKVMFAADSVARDKIKAFNEQVKQVSKQVQQPKKEMEISF